MTQSRRGSLVEAATNVLVGGVVSLALQVTLLGALGWHASAPVHVGVWACFAGASMARGYAVRRAFEWWARRRG